MSLPQDFDIDRRVARRRFDRRALSAAASGFLGREVASRMAERLDYIRHTPTRILDLGCGIGSDLPLLAQHYPQAQRIGIDFAWRTLQVARGNRSFMQRLLGSLRQNEAWLTCADAEALPLARASMDMVWSNLMLNWLADPMPALGEMHRVLRVGGMLMFSTLGPDSLRELRAAMPAGRGERVHRFIDMHDLGDCLVRAGFAEPVMDMQTLTLTYQDFDSLIQDLRQGGCSNAAHTRPRGLGGRQDWQRARHAYESLRRDGVLPATVEVVFGHAWKTAPKKTEDGRDVIQFRPRT